MKTAIRIDSKAPASERAQYGCQLAREFEKAGEYLAAIEALSDFWDGMSDSVRTAGLDEHSQAQLLVRAGCLAGWQGSVDSRIGSQELAKNLITRGIELHEQLGET